MPEREGNKGYAPFTSRALTVIRAIPAGKVATYGQVAALAGSSNGARQIVRILHTLSTRERLPWHRVIDGRGAIALPEGGGREEQVAALKAEGVRVDAEGRIDMPRYLWSPRFSDFKPG
jgi:methylated-DNA-protein-cysteine methyltransferase-like protein